MTCLDHPLLAERYFYPWPNPFPDPFYVEGRGGRLGCWYRRSFPEGLTVVHFHGNGETVADYLEGFAGKMESLGVNLMLAEYRGYGMSEGAPRLAAMLDDIDPIVQATGVDPSRLVFFGRSLGSLYAAHAASIYPMAAGLVLESAIAEPLERIPLRVEPWQLGVTHHEVSAEIDRLAIPQPLSYLGLKSTTLSPFGMPRFSSKYLTASGSPPIWSTSLLATASRPE